MSDIQRGKIRIPNLPLGQIVDQNGMPTDDEMTFRQSLITLLQELFGDEGLVLPAQTQADATIIQNHTQQVPGATPDQVYTCQLGTMLYVQSDKGEDPPNDKIVVAMKANATDDQPIFKTITVS